MKDNDSQSRVRSTTGAVSILVLFGLLVAVFVGLLVITETAQAELKPTNVVDAWDYIDLQFKHSQVNIPFNGGWTSFWHEIKFDAFDTTAGNACPAPGTTWAGQMEYGLYSVDNAPPGALGFIHTRNWELVDCDRNADGVFKNADLTVTPPTYRVAPVGADFTCDFAPTGTHCILIGQDELNPCGTGNCAQEIVTTFDINLDLDCDGAIDHPLPSAGLCFYAEAQTAYPAPGDPLWSTPLQARITVVGTAGDKTVNFTPAFAPTAIDLASFGAARQGKGILVSWETANELDNLGFNLYRSAWRNGNRAKVNGRLIASVAPGSATGATYTFLDESAAPGRSYYYWLEDLDLNGSAAQHGPAAVRGLPGRRRPMPSP
jgi:hypothetical protein